MKSAYTISVLLCITIGSLVLADNGTVPMTNETQAHNKSGPVVTIALPSSTPNSVTNSTSITTPKTTTTPTTPTTPTTTPTPTPTPTITSTPNTTTPAPTTKATTTSPPTTSTKATTSTTISTTTTGVKTTAVPSTSSPSMDRHFDGLSFFGGFILAACFMGIAVFSWKFYRQCNERNYRTL